MYLPRVPMLFVFRSSASFSATTFLRNKRAKRMLPIVYYTNFRVTRAKFCSTIATNNSYCFVSIKVIIRFVIERCLIPSSMKIISSLRQDASQYSHIMIISYRIVPANTAMSCHIFTFRLMDLSIHSAIRFVRAYYMQSFFHSFIDQRFTMLC